MSPPSPSAPRRRRLRGHFGGEVAALPLDPLANHVQDELLDLQERVSKTIIFVSHDLDEALKLGDRIALMKDGEIVQVGTAEEILTKPSTR